ncbi:hypothetical protein ACFW16_33865 [Inquilinus sp. NPDC058860]|uniref:hypothetical protein n=1 Tax=Inquilinus sp. NPDC058860 TaxID=3346652 RepID=UPI00369C3874
MTTHTKRYRAMIWIPGSSGPGMRVAVFAEDLREAKEVIESKYGPGSVFDLHNEDDEKAPR